jgi:crotonobetainyl-CoA:carnitine CoA-transferase CaiB-like acyl-CoA transferase
MDRRPGEGPLAGVRVIDRTAGIAGPVATMILGDFGAQVIRAERAEPDRGAAPPGAVMWHRNKTIVPACAIARLAETADLVVTSDAEAAESLGCPLNSRARGSRVHLHLPFWRPGAAADALTLDRMMQAEYGIARRQTSFSGGPVDGVYPFASYLQGAWGAAAAIASLIERARTGAGQRAVVDPLHGAIVAATTTMFTDPALSLPSTMVGPGGPNPAFGAYQCRDGKWLFLGALGVKFQDIAFERLGVSDITRHPRIAADRQEIYAVDLRDGVRARVAEGFTKKDRDQWLTELTEAGCPASPVSDRAGWLDHPQIVALGLRVALDDPLAGPAVTVGNPVSFSESRPAYRPRAFAPAARWSDERPPASTPPASTPPAATSRLPGSGPLHGIRVLDLGTVLAGPYAGQLLASLGADVIKVEAPKGDEFRVRGYVVNRGQRDLAIDLRDPDGYQAFGRLVRDSDVVLDNFRPGVPGRLRVDLESLRAFNPDIVTTSITGYGGIGPMGTLPGYDPVIQAVSGIMRAMGGDAEPVFSTVAVNDVTVACLAALGACAALYQRFTGRGGQAVASSLAAASAFMQSGELVRYAGRPAAETGGRDYPGPSALSRYYRCANGWVRIHLPDAAAAVRAGLASSADLPEPALAGSLAAALAGLTSEKIADLVTPHGGIVARGRDNKELLFDPATVEDGHIGAITWPDGNQTYWPRQYASFSLHDENPMMTTPGMGEHSREVLLEAGLEEPAVDRLIRAGVVVQGGPLLSVAGIGYR